MHRALSAVLSFENFDAVATPAPASFAGRRGSRASLQSLSQGRPSSGAAGRGGGGTRSELWPFMVDVAAPLVAGMARQSFATDCARFACSGCRSARGTYLRLTYSHRTATPSVPACSSRPSPSRLPHPRFDRFTSCPCDANQARTPARSKKARTLAGRGIEGEGVVRSSLQNLADETAEAAARPTRGRHGPVGVHALDHADELDGRASCSRARSRRPRRRLDSRRPCVGDDGRAEREGTCSRAVAQRSYRIATADCGTRETARRVPATAER